MISNLVTKGFSILACRVACSAVPVSFPRNGFVVVTSDALAMVAVRVLGMFEYDVRPCASCECDRRNSRRNLGLLTGLIIGSTTLSKKNNENAHTRRSCQESPHRILPPFYFCNGAEVLFLRPLVNHGFPLGTAVAFSLTSPAICTTSIAMLFKIIGKRLTVALVACVALISLALALLINAAV